MTTEDLILHIGSMYGLIMAKSWVKVNGPSTPDEAEEHTKHMQELINKSTDGNVFLREMIGEYNKSQKEFIMSALVLDALFEQVFSEQKKSVKEKALHSKKQLKVKKSVKKEKR